MTPRVGYENKFLINRRNVARQRLAKPCRFAPQWDLPHAVRPCLLARYSENSAREQTGAHSMRQIPLRRKAAGFCQTLSVPLFFKK